MFHYILNGKWFESRHADFNFQIVYKWWSQQIYKIDFKLKSSKFNVIFPVDYNLFNFNIPKKKIHLCTIQHIMQFVLNSILIIYNKTVGDL